MPTTIVVNGIRAIWGVSDCGQLMGGTNQAGLASVEPEGIYEHMAKGILEEGYTLAYKVNGNDNVKYHVYGSSNGIDCVGSHVCRDDPKEFVMVTESKTNDKLISIRNTFIISKNGTRVIIRMDITNCSEATQPDSKDLEDFLVKRYADIDVDTGGSAGWAQYKAHWDKNRYSVFTYTLDSEAPQGKRGHVVNMCAMPSDLPLDGTFVGQLGSKQYKYRNNPDLLNTPTPMIDGDGILQWRASRFLPGETFRLNMYYDTFRSFAK
jgi:hypothetical protein